MKVQRLVLAGASVAALLIAVPAMAQQADPTQYSTPSEKQQTQDLNSQSVNGVNATPAQLNGQQGQAYGNGTNAGYSGQPADQQGYGPPPDEQSDQNGYGSPPTQGQYGAQPGDQDDQDRNGPPPSEQQSQYDAQQQQYQAEQQDYQMQRAQYAAAVRRYDREEYAFTDYPQPYPYEYADHRLWRIYLIEDPTHQLAQAPVEGPNGEWVGKVRNVDINSGGQPLRVEVALNRRVSVWVSPGHFRYDPADHVVYTDLTRDQLWNFPGATYESSYWP